MQTWESLELYYKRSNGKNAAYRCLFERLNTCVTNGGARVLRSRLLQPCIDVDELRDRLDVVEELVESPAVILLYVWCE